MPCREGNKARQRLFQEAKINALPGLVEALDTETLPERSRCTLPAAKFQRTLTTDSCHSNRWRW